MGFWDVWRQKKAPLKSAPDCVEIALGDFCAAAKETQLRELCLSICINMIANAMGRCEFRTYDKNRETRGAEYWLWNYEPNVNQNSTMFVHHLVDKLYRHNEALVISTRRREGREAIVVADSWQRATNYASRQNEYRGIVVGDTQYDRTYRESEVIHLKLNNKNIIEVIDALYVSYYKLLAAAQRAYKWGHGQHWKVHIDQVSDGTPDYYTRVGEMISKNLKDFTELDVAALPEFNGYDYRRVDGDNANTPSDTRDIRALYEDIFDFTARGLLIPAVLINGKIEGTKDANTRFLTNCIDPLCDQLAEEICRKRYGYERWQEGTYLRIDSSSIIHFDVFANAASVEKLVGSGAYTINDVLRAANQATIDEEWADKHYMTLNIAGMGQSTREIDTDADAERG